MDDPFGNKKPDGLLIPEPEPPKPGADSKP
jgi:hypothetical protein